MSKHPIDTIPSAVPTVVAQDAEAAAAKAKEMESHERFRFFAHARIEHLIGLSGVSGLRVEFDDENQELRLSADGHTWTAFMLSVDAEIELMNWPGSQIDGFDEMNESVVRGDGLTNAKNPTVTLRDRLSAAVDINAHGGDA